MRSILKYMALACIALVMASCVQDLNTKPIDPNSSTTFNADRMFTKCYGCMAYIGQSGPGENSDVDWPGLDAGTSGFYRVIWYCNELSTDEAWWIWSDTESKELCQTMWEGTNTMMGAIYSRLVLNIKYCNHFLAYAPNETDEDKYRRAEVRFIRALHYYYLMDMFLYSPFVIEESSDFPHFLPRHKVYEWLVDELKDVIIELPVKRLEDYRVGKAAAQLLLARVYINADVYNKYNPEWTANSDATWQKAYTAANAVIEDNKGIHELVTENFTTDSGFVYTAYQQLFMADNHRPEVIKESLFQIYQDGNYTQSYANSIMLIAAPRTRGGMNPCGLNDDAMWQSIRTSPTLVDKFLKPRGIDRETAKDMVYDEFHMPAQLHDDRAILSSDGLTTGYKYQLKGDQLLGNVEYLFTSWSALKFTGVSHDAALPKYHVRQNNNWPDTDIPMMRLAEAYMIKAEALGRQGKWTDARDIINNVIRARAHADALPTLDEATLLDEWSREFYFEGRRRIDLVRFGRFFGPESDKYRYHWEGRMGRDDMPPAENSPFFVAGTSDHMNWFPIPSSDKRSNPNFKTDVEGDPNNIFAAQGGDGYAY